MSGRPESKSAATPNRPDQMPSLSAFMRTTEMYFSRRILTAVVLALCLAFQAEAVDIRSRADDPSKADTDGYSVLLMETGHEDFLVYGVAAVPASFGKVEGSQLTVRDDNGQHLCSIRTLAEISPGGTTDIEFHLRRDLLKNSLLTVWTSTEHEGRKSVRFVIGTFAVTPLAKAQELNKPYPIKVALAEFGRFEGDFFEGFTETDKIIFDEDRAYGFRLYLRGDGRSLPMRVETELPSPPATWGKPDHGHDLVISKDGRTASLSSMVPTEKLIENIIGVAPGDPKGEYQIRVFIREQLVKTFKFRVQRE